MADGLAPVGWPVVFPSPGESPVKWLVIWLLLTGTYLLGLLLTGAFAGGWEITAEPLVHLAVIPVTQAVALWVVAYVRRQRKGPHRAAGRSPDLPSK
jgi:hypothetical protein